MIAITENELLNIDITNIGSDGHNTAQSIKDTDGGFTIDIQEDIYTHGGMTKIQTYHFNETEPFYSYETGDITVNSVQFSKHYKGILFAGTDDGVIHIFDINNKKEVKFLMLGDFPELKNEIPCSVECSHFDPNILFVGTETGKLVILNVFGEIKLIYSI